MKDAAESQNYVISQQANRFDFVRRSCLTGWTSWKLKEEIYGTNRV